MNRQEIEAYLLELDEALAEAFPSPEPMRVLVVGGACLLLAVIRDYLMSCQPSNDFVV